jgi:spore coat-associated protein N
MHKPVKGAIALGAASLLLLGGAGTYALWSDTDTVDGGTIASGQLRFVDTTPGVWTDISEGTPGVVIPDIEEFQIVPGDVLTFSAATTLRAEGDNLAATLSGTLPTASGSPELLADVSVTTAVTSNGAPLTSNVVTEENDGDVLGILITLTFDEESGNESQLGTIDLSDLTIAVNQNPR